MKTAHRAAPPALTADECKIRASILLKDLRSDDPPRAGRAAERFHALPYFAAAATGDALTQKGSARLKHALAVVALELGYPTWADCKRRLETPVTSRLDTEKFFRGRSCGFLNHWFARYDEARASLESVGGYLLPYRHQFFVCGPDFLEAMGVDPTDPDWERIGRDWVRPLDEAARARLERKLVALGYAGEGPARVGRRVDQRPES